MDKAAFLGKDCIFAIGNAPTALIRLYELVEQKKIQPKLMIWRSSELFDVVQRRRRLILFHERTLYRSTGKKRRQQCGSGNLQCTAVSVVGGYMKEKESGVEVFRIA